MDEQTGDLRSRSNPNTESSDSEMLAGIEALLSGDGISSFTQGAEPAQGEEGGAASFYSFCAQLAASVPVADDGFRTRLLAELTSTLAEEPAMEESAPGPISEPEPSRQPPSGAEAAKPPRLRLWDRLAWGRGQESRNLSGASKGDAAGGQSRGRIVRLAIGAAGIVLLLALFAGMTAMLRLRQEATRAGATPTDRSAAPSDSSKELPGVAPVQTLDATGVQFMAWSFDGSLLATGYGSDVELWDGKSGRPIRSITVPFVSELDWSPNSSLLAVGTLGAVRIFDAATGQELHPAPPNGALEPNDQAAWSPDGKTVASSFLPVVAGTPGVPVGNGNIIPDAPAPGPAHPVPPHTPAPGENDTLVRLWDPASGDTGRILRMPADPQELGPRQVVKMSWAPGGRYLAALFSDGTIAVWDPADTGRQDPKFDINTVITVTVFGDAAHGFDWSPDGHTLATLDGTVVKLWDADTGKEVSMLPDVVPPPIVPPTQIPTAVNPLIAPPVWVPPPMPTDANGNTITPVPTVLYPTLTPSPTYVYRDQQYGLVSGLAWSPDGHTLATFDGNNIRLWDAATGQQEHRLVSDGPSRKVAWSPDGGVLFSLQGENAKSRPSEAFWITGQYAFLDGTLKLWNTTTGAQLRTISQDGLSDFALSPDRNSLAIRVGISATIWSASNLPVAGTVVPSATATLEASNTAGPTQAPCGSWSVADIPETNTEGELRAISAAGAAATDVWAVGLVGRAHDNYMPAGATATTWAMHWDGTTWSTVSTPNLGDGDNVLNGVAAISSRDAWAVGYYSATTTLRRALILYWDGSAWTNMSIPDLSNSYGKGSALNAVSARGQDDVWAVGTFDNAFTLSLHWDGKSWAQVPSPNPGVDLNTLTAVSAQPGGDVWAAGQYVQHYFPAGMPQGVPLILRWDGSRWNPVPANINGTFISALGTAPDGAAWVVGGSAGEGGGTAAASTWNGSSWGPVVLPQVHTISAGGQSMVPSSALAGTTTLSRGSAWTVGAFSVQVFTDTTGTWHEYPLVEHWDGAEWAQMITPDTGTQGSSLSAIVALSEQELWAVGHTGQYGSQDGWRYEPLILHYSGTLCATPQPATQTPDRRTAIPAVTGLPQPSIPVPAKTSTPKVAEAPSVSPSPKATK